jgi:hypothetical protein
MYVQHERNSKQAGAMKTVYINCTCAVAQNKLMVEVLCDQSVFFSCLRNLLL